MKPHKGSILGSRLDINMDPYKEINFPKNLGYIIVGRWYDHPQFGFSAGQTSLIVKKGRWKKNQCEVETLNSRYTWCRPIV